MLAIPRRSDGPNRRSHLNLLLFGPIPTLDLLAQTSILSSIAPGRHHPCHPRRPETVQGDERQGKGATREHISLVGTAFGRPATHPLLSVFEEGPEMAEVRDSALISFTLCQMNQPISPATPRIIGTSNGRVMDLMSS